MAQILSRRMPLNHRKPGYPTCLPSDNLTNTEPGIQLRSKCSIHQKLQRRDLLTVNPARIVSLQAVQYILPLQQHTSRR